MTKYENITKHLIQEGYDTWTATFTEIEDILGFPLPASARRYPSWWSNTWHGQSKSWMAAGYRARHLDLKNELVNFWKLSASTASTPTQSLELAKQLAAEFLGMRASQLELCVRA